MMDSSNWAFPDALRPRAAQLSFELQPRLDAVLRIRSEIPEQAFSAATLGTERIGNGAVIEHQGRKVVLTIGYLIAEAQNIWLRTHDGRELPGHPLAFDPVTGFGLVLPLGTLNTPALELGSSRNLDLNSEIIVVGHGGIEHAISSKLIAKREFAAYWEYLLDEALLVAPPHPQWGGTALIDAQGKLAGLGSLLIQETVNGDHFDANLFIPVDLLSPILDELLATGKVRRMARPWLGLYTTEQDGELCIAGVTQASPAYQAQLRSGDIITHVATQTVRTLPEFYRTLWAQGGAGTLITLGVKRGKRDHEIKLRSGSREDYLLKPVAN